MDISTPLLPHSILRIRRILAGLTICAGKVGSIAQKSPAPGRFARGHVPAPKASGKAGPSHRILLIERESPAQKISVFVREQINESVPVGHFDLRQRLRVHHVVVADDAIEPQDVRRHRIYFVIGERFRCRQGIALRVKSNTMVA